MERHIRENDYVLIICTPNYRLKSDGRKGGVGYEGDIMTAEVHTQRNHRKFVPIIARGTWEDVAPSWLKGKYYIDLSSPDRYRENYSDLITTLLGERSIAPPLRSSSKTSSKPQTKESSPSDPLRIVGVIVDEVTDQLWMAHRIGTIRCTFSSEQTTLLTLVRNLCKHLELATKI